MEPVIGIQKFLNEHLVPFVMCQHNNQPMRKAVFYLVSGFLVNTTPEHHPSTFKVVCDETNNTPSVIDRNEIVVDVDIAFGPRFSIIIGSQGAFIEQDT